jgi:hypothetical protein
MNRVLTRVGWTTLALAGLLGTNLTAGDFGASLRGAAGTSRKDGVKDHLAFGISYDFELSKNSHVVTELGYLYQPGMGGNVAIPANSIGAVNGNSTNFQKLSTQGLTLRGLYRSNLSGAWSWQGGLLVGSLKSRMDATGDIRDSGNAQAGGWAISPEKSALSVNPFAGFAYDLGELGHIELNLVALNYKQVTLTPSFVSGGTGTGRAVPLIGDKSVTHLNLEVGITFRF